MDIQVFIIITVIFAISITVYGIKLQMKDELAIFGDWLDIAIAASMVMFPFIAFLIDNQNTNLMFYLFLIPLLISLKTSFTNNQGNFFHVIISFISKLTIVGSVIFIILFMILGAGSKDVKAAKKQ